MYWPGTLTLQYKICSIFVHTNMLFDKVWTHLNTFVCSLAHLSAFVTKQMLNLSYVYTAFVHICLRQQMHHYPICLKDKCLICALHKCEQIWQILYLDHICPTFISFQICFFIQWKAMVNRGRFLKIYSLKFCDIWRKFYFFCILDNENFKMEVEQTIFVTFNNYSKIILLII